MRLEGARVLITGATGGLGGAIARELAARRCVLTLTGRRESDLQGLVSELGAGTRGVTADLTKLDQLPDLLAGAEPIDVLIANAGVEIPQDLGDISDAELEEAIRINLLAPAALARAVLAPMKERGAGHIVFMSSVAGIVATPGNGTVYTATKWGIRGLGLALRQELHGTGVGVSTVFPGPIRDAGMFARSGVTLPRGVPTSSPQDVARAVARAVHRNLAEVIVARGSVRFGAAVSGVAPVLLGRLSALAGAGRVREEMLAAGRGPSADPGG